MKSASGLYDLISMRFFYQQIDHTRKTPTQAQVIGEMSDYSCWFDLLKRVGEAWIDTNNIASRR